MGVFGFVGRGARRAGAAFVCSAVVLRVLVLAVERGLLRRRPGRGRCPGRAPLSRAAVLAPAAP